MTHNLQSVREDEKSEVLAALRECKHDHDLGYVTVKQLCDRFGVTIDRRRAGHVLRALEQEGSVEKWGESSGSTWRILL